MTAPVALDRSEIGPFAAALRRFRSARRMSQLELALTCQVSARHLSFLESGRARPSREMVLLLAQGLLLPLGSRNALLQAAGFASVFPASPLDSEALGPFRAILDEMMTRHSPNPALLFDRHWTALDANATGQALLAGLRGETGETNLIRMLTRNPASVAVVENLPEVIGELSGRLQLEALEAGDDEVLRGLLAELDEAAARYPHRAPPGPRSPLTPVILKAADGPLTFLTTIAQFGASQDVTVRDLRLELLFPADEQTRAAMAALAQTLSG
jgi:transcriptional regulator with XRE-family HTH domain